MHRENFLTLFVYKDHDFNGVMARDKDQQVEFDEVASKSTTSHEVFPHESLKNKVQCSPRN